METKTVKKQRTGLDFSEHVMTVTIYEQMVGPVKKMVLSVYELKKPDTWIDMLVFTNVNGILTVTGDYGNWIFCRSFAPSPEGGTSAQYWHEKLTISSTQNAKKYSAEVTRERVMEMKDDEAYKDNKEVQEWLETLLTCIEDELDYTHEAYRNIPQDVDTEYVPFGKEYTPWFLTVLDAFDEMCRRMKEEPEKIVNLNYLIQ